MNYEGDLWNGFIKMFSSEHIEDGTVYFVSPRRGVEKGGVLEMEPVEDWAKRCAVIHGICKEAS